MLRRFVAFLRDVCVGAEQPTQPRFDRSYDAGDSLTRDELSYIYDVGKCPDCREGKFVYDYRVENGQRGLCSACGLVVSLDSELLWGTRHTTSANQRREEPAQ